MVRIVITGDEGFVGTHTKNLIKKIRPDWEIIGFDRKSNRDINKPEQLREVIEEGDKILNLAGCPRFEQAENDPSDAGATNIGGTYNVGKIALEKGAERVVHASTGSVYMPVFKVPITEEHCVQGTQIYGITKRVAEEVLWYSGCRRVILRYSHLYGEGKEWGVIEAFKKRIIRGVKPVLYGGYQSKDFCYIEDVAHANILALETEHINSVFNIGTGEEMTIIDTVKAVSEVLNVDIDFEQLPPRSQDPPRMVFSIEKAKKYLGYEPKYSFRKGLEKLKDFW
tara:strand:+ start:3903 stop:4748 length:846 start_codon:yes stop_codon:yes gene_type:complete